VLENGKRRQVESDAAADFRLIFVFCRIRDGTITGDVPQGKLNRFLKKSPAGHWRGIKYVIMMTIS
jgi:hypothetical protein